ncbi:nuclear transport factor 2 family protein [Pseudonocardia sp. GCM10023141]|uniref:nuclear transport factor 2 family protein n=1 Tax=Pseudonocardia sp. GCM10023141 TaxID=3252653 RepID=UPI00361E2D4E
MVTTQSGPSTGTVERAEHDLDTALCGPDPDRPGEILAPGFTNVHFLGFAETRAEYLTGCATGVHRPAGIRRLGGRTEVFGALAVTTGRVEVVDGSSARRGTLRFDQTLVWTRDGGDAWRLAHRQQTLAQDGGPDPQDRRSDTTGAPVTDDEVRAGEDAFHAAQTASDVAALGDLFAEDLWFSHTTGRLDGKDAYLAAVTDGAYAHGGIWTVQRATLLGEGGAVSTGLVDMVVRPPGARPFSMRFHQVLVWRRGERGLVLTARQATRQPL